MKFVNVIIQSILTVPILETLTVSKKVLKYYMVKEISIVIVGSSKLFAKVLFNINLSTYRLEICTFQTCSRINFHFVFVLRKN